MSPSQKLSEKTKEKSLKKVKTADNLEKHIDINDIFRKKLKPELQVK